jgi:rod shape-determining protein MreB
MAEALSPLLMEIAESVKEVFNVTPPELVADIMEKGVILSGGSAQLGHLPEFFERFLGVPSYVAEDPLFCVARGTGIILDHLDAYKRTLLNKR